MLRKVSGVIIPSAPVIHGAPNADKGGRDNHSPGRRIPLLLQAEKGEGVVSYGYRDVNVVSGNGIRGLGRRLFASYTLDVLGVKQEELPKETVMLLFVGGATGAGYRLDKIAAGTILKVRETLPFVDLLGGTVRGHFIAGVLRVGFAIPYLLETAWMNTSPYTLAKPPTYQDFEAQVLKDLEYVRYQPEVSWHVLPEDAPPGDGESVQMIYTAEAIPAGTNLLHSFAAVPVVNSATKAAMDAFIALFVAAAHVGGWSRAGHGAFVARYYDELTRNEYSPSVKDYTDHLEKHRAQIVKMLKDLPSMFPVRAREGESEEGTGDEEQKAPRKRGEK